MSEQELNGDRRRGREIVNAAADSRSTTPKPDDGRTLYGDLSMSAIPDLHA